MEEEGLVGNGVQWEEDGVGRKAGDKGSGITMGEAMVEWVVGVEEEEDRQKACSIQPSMVVTLRTNSLRAVCRESNFSPWSVAVSPKALTESSSSSKIISLQLVSEFVDCIARERRQKQSEAPSDTTGGGAEVDRDEIEMMKKLGIPLRFDPTKGKLVPGADVSGVRAVTKRQPR
ncbi:hypothetical protein NE237_002326 [Protea cynaroides]|uniref:U4/U6.U5 small nuclear ribonucleoprotein 27kDa protein domain-containing protein n=1 Tax=Protea cynaroides TaxID=273540 RepID=A0A9Q0QZD1_9MAGN|nr:hypothetical protein NE237_002326 [Protea cynaroides]